MKRPRTLKDLGIDTTPDRIDQLGERGFWAFILVTVGILIAVREGWVTL